MEPEKLVPYVDPSDITYHGKGIYSQKTVLRLKPEHDDGSEKCESKLEQAQGHLRVLIDDITYQMRRTEGRTLASVDEHQELIEEIHDAQRILANFETYAQTRIAEIAAKRAITDMLQSIRLQTGIAVK